MPYLGKVQQAKHHPDPMEWIICAKPMEELAIKTLTTSEDKILNEKLVSGNKLQQEPESTQPKEIEVEYASRLKIQRIG